MFSKKLKFKLWQLMIYEISILSLGIVIGVYWFNYFKLLIPILLSIFIIFGFYIIKVSWQQIKEKNNV